MAATLPSTIRIRENVALRDFTTFRVGGPARFFCEVSSEAELAEERRLAHERKAATEAGGGHQAHHATSPVWVILAWTAVGVPLAWGVWITLQTAQRIFG